MGQIKAIETKYKGYRFRSRTEARWAVFFDNFGLDWEYEKEGFELPSGLYLPDFWVTWGEFEAWIEVKGVRPDGFSVEHKLCHELANASQKDVLLVVGIPGENYITHYLPSQNIVWTSDCAKISDFLGPQDRIDYAVEYAKSARFEHGETP